MNEVQGGHLTTLGEPSPRLAPPEAQALNRTNVPKFALNRTNVPRPLNQTNVSRKCPKATLGGSLNRTNTLSKFLSRRSGRMPSLAPRVCPGGRTGGSSSDWTEWTHAQSVPEGLPWVPEVGEQF